MRRALYSMVAVAVMSLVFVGCGAGAKMVVPADVLTMPSDYLAVTGRSSASGSMADESFQLGPYAVSNVNRDWDSTHQVKIWTSSKERTTSGYTYTFAATAGEMSGGCQVEGNTESVSSFSGRTSMSQTVSKIGCTCQVGDAAVEGVLDSNNGSEYEGTVRLRDGEMSIKAVYELDGPVMVAGNPSGYRVDSDSVQAAVDVMHPGRVWLNKELSETQRDDLSCLFVGLMLYKGPKAKDSF